MHNAHLWPATATIGADGRLLVGGCDIVTLAHAYGTPLYLLDEATFRDNCRAWRNALAQQYAGATSVHYAGKALLNTAVARLAASEGLGLDVVSGGELFVALHAGVPAARIHLHGNAKPLGELEQALAAEIGNIMVDNLDELALLAQLTRGRAVPQPIMLRLTPKIAPDTHAHIQTGQANSKFGLPLEALDAAAGLALAAPGLRLHGLHAHLGSQIFTDDVYIRAIDVLLDCAARLRDRCNLAIDELSPGGGLGVPYIPEQPVPDIAAYAAAIGRAVTDGCAARGLPLPRLVIEPGRSIVARAGIALYTVVARKHLRSDEWPTPALPLDPSASLRAGKLGNREGEGTDDQQRRTTDDGPGTTRFVHIDGGMGDNVRSALYGARYTALLANRAAESPGVPVQVSGRYCESGDILLRDCPLPAAEVGDILAVAMAGAYTLSMASTYNLVPRPALLLVGGGQARLIQRRETYADLVARDT
jgi:diaminopimelate decarboxylase